MQKIFERGRLLAGLFVLAALLGLSSRPASAAVGAAPTTWHVQAGWATKDQALQGMVFLPKEIWVDAGDTVTWTIRSGEFHTITFLPRGEQRPPFNPNDPKQTQRQGGSTYDGTGYLNSGLLMLGTPNTSYSLTFTKPGDYQYICLVHTMMSGVVHVRPAGTAYPYTQAQYDQQAPMVIARLHEEGNRLISQAHQTAARNKGEVVMAGNGDVAVMRFLPRTIRVGVGDTVTWVNQDVETPHTITLGKEPEGGPLAAFAPYGDPRAYDGSKPLNSGFIGADPHWFGKTFSVTFTRAGTYHYICALHDEMGMRGTVVVDPAMPNAGGGGTSPESHISGVLPLLALAGLLGLGLIPAGVATRRARRAR